MSLYYQSEGLLPPPDMMRQSSEIARALTEDIHTYENDGGDLDIFFKKVYNYFVEKGFWCIITSRLMNLISLAFTIGFSTFLMLFVKWGELANCADANTSCDAFPGVRSDLFTNPSAGEALVFLYFCIFSMYWLWGLYSFLYSVRDAHLKRVLFNEKMGVQDRDLMNVEWCVVVDKLVKLQESGHIIMKTKKTFTALDITNRIMRADNYLIALVNEDVFRFGVFPEWLGGPDRGAGVVFGSTLQWNIRYGVLSYMFDSQFALRREFLEEHGVAAMRWRFRLLGVANLVLMPFIMIFMVILFFLKHAEELHSKRTSLGPREWTRLAQIKLREFNELSHFFNRRLNASYKPAAMYIRQFPNMLVSIIAKTTAYVAGAVVGVLVLLTFADSNLLINLKILDRPLLWYLAIFSAALAISRAMTHSEVVVFRPKQVMAKVNQHTHYMPDHWRDQTHTVEVRNEFSQLYRPRILVFVTEVLSVALCPFVLLFWLPQQAAGVVDFVDRMTIRDFKGMGALCRHGVFDFEKLGDKAYGELLDRQDAHDAAVAAADVEGGGRSHSSRNIGEGGAASGSVPDHPRSARSSRSQRRSDVDLLLASDNEEEGGSGSDGPDLGAELRGRRWDRRQRRRGSRKQQPATPRGSVERGDKDGMLSPRDSGGGDGKMEKSFLSFAINHPTWQTQDESGARMLASLAGSAVDEALGGLPGLRRGVSDLTDDGGGLQDMLGVSQVAGEGLRRRGGPPPSASTLLAQSENRRMDLSFGRMVQSVAQPPQHSVQQQQQQQQQQPQQPLYSPRRQQYENPAAAHADAMNSILLSGSIQSGIGPRLLTVPGSGAGAAGVDTAPSVASPFVGGGRGGGGYGSVAESGALGSASFMRAAQDAQQLQRQLELSGGASALFSPSMLLSASVLGPGGAFQQSMQQSMQVPRQGRQMLQLSSADAAAIVAQSPHLFAVLEEKMDARNAQQARELMYRQLQQGQQAGLVATPPSDPYSGDMHYHHEQQQHGQPSPSPPPMLEMTPQSMVDESPLLDSYRGGDSPLGIVGRSDSRESFRGLVLPVRQQQQLQQPYQPHNTQHYQDEDMQRR